MATWQKGIASEADQGKICSFDYEVIEQPTRALMHQAARFLYFKKGLGIIQIDGVQYKIVPNTMIAITPYEISDMIQVTETMQFVKIIYDYSYINLTLRSSFDSGSDIAELLRLLSSQPAVYLSPEQARQIDSIMDSMRDELGIESTMQFPPRRELSTIYTANKLIELMILYGRFFTANNEHYMDVEQDADAVDMAQGQSILSYIYAHSEENLTLEKLAKVFFMSESSVSKFITEQTGSSFTGVMESIRIEKATDYLIHTSLNLNDIAMLTGFTDASYLSKKFSAKAGITPAEYRRIYKRTNTATSGKTDKDLSYRITDYLYKNYQIEKLAKETVAKHFGISANELNRSLLYYTGKSYDTLLNFIRINRAAEKLIASDDRIIDIAVDVGYSSIKTFNLNFYKYRGMTPTEFRDRITLQHPDGTEEISERSSLSQDR